jgi:hypothetical protein
MDDERSMSFYRSFGLNDQQIGIIAGATPKREYYFTSPLGIDCSVSRWARLGSPTARPPSATISCSPIAGARSADGAFNDEYLSAPRDWDWRRGHTERRRRLSRIERQLVIKHRRLGEDMKRTPA